MSASGRLQVTLEIPHDLHPLATIADTGAQYTWSNGAPIADYECQGAIVIGYHRRSYAVEAGLMKQFESFCLDTSNQCLWRNGEQIFLPLKPFGVLRYLVEHPGRLITHDELLDALWPETYVQPQVLRTYMLDLRKALNDDAGKPRFIQTLPKRGYCFVAPVKDCETSEATSKEVPSKDDWAGQERRTKAEPISIQEPKTTFTAQDSPVKVPMQRGKLNDPAAVEPSAPCGIVAREQELARLGTEATLAAGGQRRVVFVTGEAGIGKTALVDEFCCQPDAPHHATIAQAQCVEGFGAKEEYYPIMEALRQLCASSDGDRACRILTRIAPVWLAALGRGSDIATRSEAQQRMPGDLCAALEELAADQPLTLIFEDLHWADDSSLHLISALARRRTPARLLIVGTYRPGHAAQHTTQDESGSGPTSVVGQALKSLKQDLHLRRLCTEIPLTPLSKTGVRELLSRELHQQALPPGLANFVHQRSEGNPLFVIAILEHLTALHFLAQEKVQGKALAKTSSGSDEEVQWQQQVPFAEMEASVPDGLAQMIESEIDRLSPYEQRMLEAGSLISVAFPSWAVAAALEEDPAETEEACDALARRLYFVQRAGQDELPDGSSAAFYVFAHELYREVLYRRQGSARRARRHIRIAERLRALFADREAIVAREMAMHYEAAGEWRRALQALRSAAVHAQQRQAEAEAAELLEHALRLAANLSGDERTTTERDLRCELQTS